MEEKVNIGEVEAFSLFGEPLFRTPLRPETEKQQRSLYDKALQTYRINPEGVDEIVWLGRRTAYLGRYREAAAIFSTGIEKHPNEPKFLRHRGHRFITLRRFELAAENLEKAAKLIRDTPDEIEPDGIPNERNTPVSSLHFNIWYHLGLAHYLRGNFPAALNAYRECMEVSEIPDKKVATAHWLYMTLRRMGLEDEAEETLKGISGNMVVIENKNYHDCLLMYKGIKTLGELLKESRAVGVLGLVTTGYGVANWLLYNNKFERAAEVLREIITTGAWAGFGYIAAEADMERLELRP